MRSVAQELLHGFPKARMSAGPFPDPSMLFRTIRPTATRRARNALLALYGVFDVKLMLP
jgi:hypothetical protein